MVGFRYVTQFDHSMKENKDLRQREYPKNTRKQYIENWNMEDIDKEWMPAKQS